MLWHIRDSSADYECRNLPTTMLPLLLWSLPGWIVCETGLMHALVTLLMFNKVQQFRLVLVKYFNWKLTVSLWVFSEVGC